MGLVECVFSAPAGTSLGSSSGLRMAVSCTSTRCLRCTELNCAGRVHQIRSPGSQGAPSSSPLCRVSQAPGATDLPGQHRLGRCLGSLPTPPALPIPFLPHSQGGPSTAHIPAVSSGPQTCLGQPCPGSVPAPCLAFRASHIWPHTTSLPHCRVRRLPPLT